MILSATKSNERKSSSLNNTTGDNTTGDVDCDCATENSTSAGSTAVEASATPAYLCSVRQAARIVGQKWTLQIVNVLMDFHELRFCEMQERLGNVNPSTLSARLKMLEEEGILMRSAVSAAPPYVTYRLTDMGNELSGVIQELTNWSSRWLCEPAPADLVPDPVLDPVLETVQ